MNVLRDLVPRPPTRFLGAGRQQQHQEHLVLPDGNSLICVYTRHETGQQSTPLCVLYRHTHTHTSDYMKMTKKKKIKRRSRSSFIQGAVVWCWQPKAKPSLPPSSFCWAMEGNYMAVCWPLCVRFIHNDDQEHHTQHTVGAKLISPFTSDCELQLMLLSRSH